ncbi:MAG: hypothetical protein V3T61_06265, partial [Acidobacteriota bacterium]
MAQILTTRKRWTTLSVLLAVYLLAPLSSFARLNGSQSENGLVHLEQKVAAGLREEVAYLSTNPQIDHEIPIIVKVNSDFFEQSLAQGGSNPNALRLISAYRSRLTGAQIRLLLDSPLVEYVTIDVPIRTSSDEFTPSGWEELDLDGG